MPGDSSACGPLGNRTSSYDPYGSQTSGQTPQGSASTPLVHTVDGEKLRAMLLINPTKSTLLPILNQGEVGQTPRQTSCIWFNRQLILLQSSPIKLPASHLALNHLNQT